MIEINGLTPYQVALLDEMWACDSYEEFTAFLDTLSAADRFECMKLERMILLAQLDEEMLDAPLTEANDVLSQFRL